MVVGAYGVGISGAIYVFDRDEGGADIWGEVTKVSSPTPDGGNDLFGSDVAVECDTILVGAVYESNVLADAGAVYILAVIRAGGMPGDWSRR